MKILSTALFKSAYSQKLQIYHFFTAKNVFYFCDTSKVTKNIKMLTSIFFLCAG